jgi:hypothetical protein
MDKAGGGVDYRTGSCSSVAHQNSAPGDHCHHDPDNRHHRYDAHLDKHLHHFDQHLHVDQHFDHTHKHRHNAYHSGGLFDPHSRTAVCRLGKAGLLIAQKCPTEAAPLTADQSTPQSTLRPYHDDHGDNRPRRR